MVLGQSSSVPGPTMGGPGLNDISGNFEYGFNRHFQHPHDREIVGVPSIPMVINRSQLAGRAQLSNGFKGIRDLTSPPQSLNGLCPYSEQGKDSHLAPFKLAATYQTNYNGDIFK